MKDKNIDYQKGKDQLSQGDMEFEYERDKAISPRNTTGPGVVQPQDFYNESQSEIYYWLWRNESNKYTAMINWKLKRDNDLGSAIDYPAPKDGAVIGWEGSQWGYIKNSLYRAQVLRWKAPNGEVMDSELRKPKVDSFPLEKPKGATGLKPNDAVRSDHDSNPQFPQNINGVLSIGVRKQDDATGNISLRYRHTWVNTVSAIGNLLGTVGLTGKGVSANFEVPTGTYSWKARKILDD